MIALRPSSLALSLLVAAAAAAGCGDPGPTTAGSATGSAKPRVTASAKASAKPSTSAAPAASADADRGGMSHCPNAVEGARVDVKDDPKGVVMTVTATDAKATTSIRERAKWVTEKAKAEVDKIQHTGEGGGGGVLGQCPIVLKGTTVKVADTEGGSTITIEVADAKEVDWLRREVRERQAKLGQPGADDLGQKKMANCPSAANGASTKVEEKGGAVVVTVTTKDAAGIADVRDRAKKLADAAKAEASDKHDGLGGGAGTGRCPIVLEETTIASKEVEGGVEVTVTPKKPADLAKVSKEAKERAERFAAKAKEAGGGAAPATSASAKP